MFVVPDPGIKTSTIDPGLDGPTQTRPTSLSPLYATTSTGEVISPLFLTVTLVLVLFLSTREIAQSFLDEVSIKPSKNHPRSSPQEFSNEVRMSMGEGCLNFQSSKYCCMASSNLSVPRYCLRKAKTAAVFL